MVLVSAARLPYSRRTAACRLGCGAPAGFSTWRCFQRPTADALQREQQRCFAGSSQSSKSLEESRRRQDAIAATRAKVQAEQLMRFRPVAPFREVAGSTSGSAVVMASMLRPTSPSLLRLLAGLAISMGCVAGMHWILYPSDPFFVLSASGGAFAYVAVVGISHSPLWYAGSLPVLALALLPNWAAYQQSLQASTQMNLHRTRRS
mmetsp:Transcript_56044/g.133513  ORF Transcript_56044/g.133513 Transcript_56044/m.133513 type:complete len:205 (+) Transcript_56044:49-663(+)